MTAVTLDEIKATQEKLAKMIDQFDKNSKKLEDLFPINIGLPQLNKNEKWLGLVMSADGSKKDHVILLPGEANEVNWDDATKWAESIGGKLPDRVEQALLFKTMKNEFKEEPYWSCEQHANEAEWAWYQGFKYGIQYYHPLTSKLRARAVRRISVI